MADDIAAWHKDCFNRYFPLVYRRCLDILHNPDDAEDTAHDVFERLLRLKVEGRLEIRPEGLAGLLSTMAKNTSRNHFRKRRREACRFYAIAVNVSLNRVRDSVKEKDMGAGEILDRLITRDTSSLSDWKHIIAHGYSEQVEGKLLAEVLLDETDEKTRDICFMRYYYRMTLKDIGEAVGLSKAAVEKRLRKFENQARMKLEKDEK